MCPSGLGPSKLSGRSHRSRDRVYNNATALCPRRWSRFDSRPKAFARAGNRVYLPRPWHASPQAAGPARMMDGVAAGFDHAVRGAVVHPQHGADGDGPVAEDVRAPFPGHRPGRERIGPRLLEHSNRGASPFPQCVDRRGPRGGLSETTVTDGGKLPPHTLRTGPAMDSQRIPGAVPLRR